MPITKQVKQPTTLEVIGVVDKDGKLVWLCECNFQVLEDLEEGLDGPLMFKNLEQAREVDKDLELFIGKNKRFRRVTITVDPTPLA